MRIWLRGTIHDNIGANIELDGDKRIEMKSHAGYFTVTGEHLSGTPTTIVERQAELDLFYHGVLDRRAAAKKQLVPDRINNDVAELYNARFVTASENAQGSRLNEAFIKKTTGKEPLRARRLHENEFEFMPNFTLWLAVNHKPEVKDTSKGMWRRVHFIPFRVTIDEHQIDKHLGEKLLEEAEGVLAWLVEGCLAWYRQGHLLVPQLVTDATAAYRAEMNTVGRFIEEECELRQDRKIDAKSLLSRYETWCEKNGERYEAKSLRAGLQERGLQSNKSTGGFYYWFGIGLKDNPIPIRKVTL